MCIIQALQQVLDANDEQTTTLATKVMHFLTVILSLLAFVFSNSDKKGFHQKRYLSVFHNSWLLASQLLICVLGKISYLQVVESDIFYADPSSVDSPQLSLLLAEVSVVLWYGSRGNASCAVRCPRGMATDFAGDFSCEKCRLENVYNREASINRRQILSCCKRYWNSHNYVHFFGMWSDSLRCVDARMPCSILRSSIHRKLNLPGWKRFVVVCMCLAVIFEILCLIWNLVAFCTCCCKKFIIHPLGVLTFITTILLALVVIVYGINNKQAIDSFYLFFILLGYSFWLCVGALAIAAVDTVVAVLTVCLGDNCL
uniref:Palmitoyltransferase n=1 Tax=Heterorhabditis bacteriophora TaxID=37862 RepID=A0A1I7XCB4_HETBA